MDSGRTEYSFQWFIENYSYCWHENGEQLDSPEFTADGLEGTHWYISLFPRREDDDAKGNISIYLVRSEVDDGPEDFLLKFELSIAAYKSVHGPSEYTFKKGDGYGPSIPRIKDERKADYLPQDTLSVCCNLWKGEGDIQQVKQFDARTRIGIEHISFLHVVENFSAFKPNQKNTVKITSPSKKGLDLSSSLYFFDDPCFEGKIVVEIAPSDSNKILSTCKLSLIDTSKKLIKCGDVDNRINDKKNIQKLPLTLTRPVILNRKNEYLPGDELSLFCKCTFSTGVEYEKIESTLHEIPFVTSQHINDNDQEMVIYNAEEKLSKCLSGLDDLKTMYKTQCLTDVELKTKTKSFFAHKLVLCARSSVFNAMLTNDMRERNNNCIQVDDLEDNIVHQLLLFLYSDNVENFEWESAIKLYYAADKYALGKLKVLCSSFLIDNLNVSNASELLLLCDTHNDSDLKTAVEDFIFKHDDQVFCSDKWRNLIKTNPVLVSMTMCLKYVKKL